MMQEYAEQAVRFGRERKLQLDYSEQSLVSVEAVLDQLAVSSAGEARPETLDEMAKMWGGYFGEVVRRHFGGEWVIDKYPAGDFLIVTLKVAGARLFPSMKVHKRLTEGETENLWSFYQSVKKRLQATTGARVN